MSKCISVFVFFCKWRFTIYKKVCIKPTKLQKEFKIIIKCNFFFVLVLSLYICKMCFRTVPFFSMEVFNVWTILSSVSSRYSLMLQKEFWWNSIGKCFIFFLFLVGFWFFVFCFYFFFCLILHACVINNLGRQGLGCV